MALLYLSLEFIKQNQVNLAVVHVNHCLRGQESDEDERFVAALAARNGVPFYSSKKDVRQYARDHKHSLEEAARIVRYAYFDLILDKTKAKKLATAHTADDQAETLLDRFLRGSGSAGLAGMRPSRGRYLHPLLTFSRMELHKYVADNGLTYREDSSNTDLSFRRNRIRGELLPYLRKHFNPALTQTLCRGSVVFQEIEDYLSGQSKTALKSLVSLRTKNEIVLDIDRFMTYNYVIQKYVLFQCCHEFSISKDCLDFNRLNRILALIKCNRIGTRAAVGADKIEVLIDHDGVVFLKKEPEALPRVRIDLLNREPVAYHRYKFDWSIFQTDGVSEFIDNPKIELFDMDKVGRVLTLRKCKPGDSFVPLNFQGHKKVSNFFSDAKVPLRQRRFVPVLESEQGILWICGFRMDDRFKITDSTKQILRMEMKDCANAD